MSSLSGASAGTGNETSHRSVHIFRGVKAPGSCRHMGIGGLLSDDILLSLSYFARGAQKIKHVQYGLSVALRSNSSLS